MRMLGFSLVLVAAVAHAEAGWLAAQGRISPRSELTLFAGPRSIGVGYSTPDADLQRGVSIEAAWLWQDRVAEVTAARRWLLSTPGAATSSATAGLTGLFVPFGTLDLGLGPQIGLNLGLGSEKFSVEFGAQSGVEAFVRGSYRFTERLQLGVRAQLGRVKLGVAGRMGVDLLPGRSFIVRADAIVSVGWLGAER